MIFDLTGQGRTVLKANWGRYAWNPGTALSRGRERRIRPTGTSRYAWTDTNGNRLYDRGEEGVIIARRGGAASAVPRSEHQEHA